MSVEDKCFYSIVEYQQLQKENYELKSHIESLSDGFHEVIEGLKGELLKTTNDLNSQIRENLGFVNRLAFIHKRLKMERKEVCKLQVKIEELLEEKG